MKREGRARVGKNTKSNTYNNWGTESHHEPTVVISLRVLQGAGWRRMKTTPPPVVKLKNVLQRLQAATKRQKRGQSEPERYSPMVYLSSRIGRESVSPADVVEREGPRRIASRLTSINLFTLLATPVANFPLEMGRRFEVKSLVWSYYMGEMSREMITLIKFTFECQLRHPVGWKEKLGVGGTLERAPYLQSDDDLSVIISEQGVVIAALQACPFSFQCISEADPFPAADKKFNGFGTRELCLARGRLVRHLR